MFGKARIVEKLQNAGLLEGLETHLLGQILDQMSPETWLAKRSVPADDLTDQIHIIINGRIEVSRINPQNGRSIMLFLLAPGDAFDILHLLTGRPLDAVFFAHDDVDLLTCPMSKMRDFISTHPELNRNFLPYLGSQMRALADLAGDLALHDTETRLAHLIMRHIDDKDGASAQIRLINDLSHEKLAEMIGSVRAVINRQLQHWRKQGIISLDHGHIKIRQLKNLLERANENR